MLKVQCEHNVHVAGMRFLPKKMQLKSDCANHYVFRTKNSVFESTNAV